MINYTYRCYARKSKNDEEHEYPGLEGRRAHLQIATSMYRTRACEPTIWEWRIQCTLHEHGQAEKNAVHIYVSAPLTGGPPT